MKNKLLLCTALVSIPALLGASGAYAQEAEKETWGVSEIIVTAQKREQRLQDVPASVSALTGDSLTVARVQTVSDLDALTPNLIVKPAPGGSSAPTYSMRGVVSLGTAPGADKGVALYIDGVIIGSASGSIFDLAEVERIEVLKGPQGTLFGRNSTGGAISITTRGPAGEFGIKQDLTYGNYEQFRSRTRIDTPQWGPFSAALTYTHTERRGETRNLGGGTAWDFSRVGGPSRIVSPKWLGSNNTESWAASIKYDVTPNLDLVYKFDRTDGTFSDAAWGFLNFTASGATLRNLNAVNPLPTPQSQVRPDAVNNWFSLPNEIMAEGHVLTANWRISDSLTVKNVFGYRRGEYSAPGAQLDGLGGLFTAPNVPFLGVTSSSAGTDKQYSEELQIDYESDFMHVTAGGLWYRQENQKGPYGTGFNSPAFLAAPGFVVPAPPIPAAQSSVTVTSIAAYAHGEFHVLDKLDVVAGARKTDDKKRGIDRTILTSIGNLDFDGGRWTYEGGLNFKPTSDILIYGKYSTGYISGGRLSTLNYLEETAKSWEGGVKSEWFNSRLRANLALFSVKYKNLQFPGSGIVFGVPAAPQVLVNAGDAKAKGFELEMSAAPVEHLTFNASVGHLDFEFTRLDPRFVAAGNTAIATRRPRWTGNVSAQFTSPPVFDDARITLRADANYKSHYADQASLALIPFTHVPNVVLVNGRLALENFKLGGGNATVALWGKNLLDEDSKTFALTVGAAVSAAYERARTVGVDLTWEY